MEKKGLSSRKVVLQVYSLVYLVICLKVWFLAKEEKEKRLQEGRTLDLKAYMKTHSSPFQSLFSVAKIERERRLKEGAFNQPKNCLNSWKLDRQQATSSQNLLSFILI